MGQNSVACEERGDSGWERYINKTVAASAAAATAAATAAAAAALQPTEARC